MIEPISEVNPVFTKPLELHGHPMTTQSKSGIVKNNLKYALQVSATSLVPTGFSDAKEDARLKKAMDDEISYLCQNKTWILVSLDLSHNVLLCKWVF